LHTVYPLPTQNIDHGQSRNCSKNHYSGLPKKTTWLCLFKHSKI